MVVASGQRLDPAFRKAIIKRKLPAYGGMDNFVQNYGRQITDVKVYDNVEKINLLAEFCVEGRLRELELVSVSIADAGIITRSKAILSGVAFLDIEICEISDDNLGYLLAMCPQLENLRLSVKY